VKSGKLRIAVLGAGGLGGLYGALLARAGHTVAFLARGAQLDAIRARGLEVRTPEGTFVAPVTAFDEPGALDPADLAIVAVKCYSLESIAPAAGLLATRGAIVIPLLNGVDAADRLAAAGVTRSSILGGVASVSAVRVAPGIVERKSSFQTLTVGELLGGMSPRAEKIAEVFRGAGIDARATTDISADLWRKLAFIASMAAACGLARAPVGMVRDAPYGHRLFERLIREVFAVARALHVNLAEGEEDKMLRFVDSLGAGLKPSFLLDLESGGPNELDDLSGAVARLGREAGVDTPVHDTAVTALGIVRPRTS
jgi:2-dehydropantoate 2-reductase